MKNFISGLSIAALLFFSLILMPTSASAIDMGLVSTLVNKLGVSKSQAQGGSGAIFKTAEKRMDKDDYRELKKEVPEVETLQKFAPKTADSKSSMLGSAASALGGKTGSSVGDAAGLLSSFDALGMDQDMLNKFTPVIYDYVKKNGSEMAMGLLQKALAF